MCNAHNDIDSRICSIVVKHGRLSIDAVPPGADTDLYKAGMTSHATVNVMLALEGEFDVEFPDAFLTRSVFTSIATIRNALITIGPSQ